MAEPHNTPARTRPGVVTISSYLLILFAVTQVISMIASLTTIGGIRDAFEAAYTGPDPEVGSAVATVGIAVAIGTSIFLVLLAVGLFVLAMLNNRGKNWSRITTWVVGGIMICCTGGNLISGAAGMGNQSSPDLDTAELERRLAEAVPGWLNGLTIALGVIGLLALIGALVLLALPAANEFFRKPQGGGWEPPMPGSSYPGGQGQPGYPANPGYPATPGYPQTPGTPGQSAPGEFGSGQAGPPHSGPQPGEPPASGTEGHGPSDRPS